MHTKVLVANRGEIACRILSTLRRLGIPSVAVYSDADAASLHRRLADEAVRIGPAAVAQSYLSLAALGEAMKQSGATALHPGYGLLSERPELPRLCASLGVGFIGPSASAMETLGDKIKARAAASAVGLFPPPGTEAELDVTDFEGARRVAEQFGYPLVVKAAAGGGGIGMQRVADDAELQSALRVCAERAQAAFGDGRLYLERWLNRPRHIELQVLRDAQGGGLVLGARECSVQRRHQKVIEECPPPALGPAGIPGDLERAALRLLDAVGYVGVATVELVRDDSGSLYFLEVNTRLQVEHPVTEAVWGVDVVELQLRLAAGQTVSSFPLASATGHAIEARLYAEDPRRNFLPQPGVVSSLVWPSGEGLRVDTGVEQGAEVSSHYDPLMAKVIAHGETREQARVRLLEALERLEVVITGKAGPKVTNRDWLRQVLSHPDFIAGDYDTSLASRV